MSLRFNFLLSCGHHLLVGVGNEIGFAPLRDQSSSGCSKLIEFNVTSETEQSDRVRKAHFTICGNYVIMAS